MPSIKEWLNVLYFFVWPTWRNLGVGAGAVAGRIGGIVAPQLVFLVCMVHFSPIPEEWIHDNTIALSSQGTHIVVLPFIVSSGLCFLMLPLVLFLEETKGKPLHDVLWSHDLNSHQYMYWVYLFIWRCTSRLKTLTMDLLSKIVNS